MVHVCVFMCVSVMHALSVLSYVRRSLLILNYLIA